MADSNTTEDKIKPLTPTLTAVTAVAIAIPDWSGGDALIIGTKMGSLARKCCDAGEALSDLGLPCPPMSGLWLWLDGGSRQIWPSEFDEDGGINWIGEWIRPSDDQAIAIAGGIMPWDLAGPAESPAEAERLRLHAEVAEHADLPAGRALALPVGGLGGVENLAGLGIDLRLVEAVEPAAALGVLGFRIVFQLEFRAGCPRRAFRGGSMVNDPAVGSLGHLEIQLQFKPAILLARREIASVMRIHTDQVSIHHLPAGADGGAFEIVPAGHVLSIKQQAPSGCGFCGRQRIHCGGSWLVVRLCQRNECGYGQERN